MSFTNPTVFISTFQRSNAPTPFSEMPIKATFMLHRDFHYYIDGPGSNRRLPPLFVKLPNAVVTVGWSTEDPNKKIQANTLCYEVRSC